MKIKRGFISLLIFCVLIFPFFYTGKKVIFAATKADVDNNRNDNGPVDFLAQSYSTFVSGTQSVLNSYSDVINTSGKGLNVAAAQTSGVIDRVWCSIKGVFGGDCNEDENINTTNEIPKKEEEAPTEQIYIKRDEDESGDDNEGNTRIIYRESQTVNNGISLSTLNSILAEFRQEILSIIPNETTTIVQRVSGGSSGASDDYVKKSEFTNILGNSIGGSIESISESIMEATTGGTTAFNGSSLTISGVIDSNGTATSTFSGPVCATTFYGDGSNLTGISAGDSLPDQTGNSGKYLTTDGADASWATISAGASELSDLSDVLDSTQANRNVLVSNGTTFASRALVEADISDLGTYLSTSDLNSLSTIEVGDTNTASGENSLAVGYNNTASSENSIAFGWCNNANTYCEASAIGGLNIASGYRSSAFGYENIASCFWSSAFGYNNTASGYRSSAFGYKNIACGAWSSVSGYCNTASAYCASAFGFCNIAEAASSTASGICNTISADNDNSVAFGNSNMITSSSGYYSACGTGRNVALGIENTVSGSGYLGDANNIAVGIGNTSSASGLYDGGASSAVGYSNTSSGKNSSAFGYCNTASGDYSSAFGYENTASNYWSSAFGWDNTASGYNSLASGSYNKALGDYSSASGYYNCATECYSSVFGSCNTASGDYSSASGYYNCASTINSQVFGRSNFTGTGDAVVAIGILNNQTGAGINTASGYIVGTSSAYDAGNVSTAVGILNIASATRSSAVGYSNTASGLSGSAFGRNNEAFGNSSSAIGVFNTASANYSTASGYYNEVYGVSSSAFGRDNQIVGLASSAFGAFNYETDTSDKEMCFNSIVGYDNDIAQSSTACIQCATIIGYNNDVTASSGNISGITAVGLQNNPYLFGATAVGWCNTAGCKAISLGYFNCACGDFSTASGYSNAATGNRSVSMGWNNTASGYRATASGYCNIAESINSIAIGHRNHAHTNCESAAIGGFNTASGCYSSAFGWNNESSGIGSVAFGRRNCSTADCSVAFGYDNDVFGAGCSSAIGFFNTECNDGQYTCVHSNTLVGFSNSIRNISTAQIRCGTFVGYGNDAAVLSGTYDGVTAVGYSNFALGNNASSVGYDNDVRGDSGSAFGFCNTSCGTASSAFGYDNAACNTNSSAFGNNIEHNIANAARIGSTNTAALTLCCTGVSSAEYHLANIVDGTLSVSGGVITSSSDEKLKNVSGTFDRGLDDLLEIEPILYTWKQENMNTPGSIYAGFSAQNVQVNIPEAVSEGSNGYLGLSDRPILAASVNAIKELDSRTLDLSNTTTNNASSTKQRIDSLLSDSEGLRIDLDELKVSLEDLELLTASTTESLADEINENSGLLATVSSSVEDILDRIQGFGGEVIDGAVNFVEVAIQRLTVQKVVVNNEENPDQTGIVIYDRKTGEPICVYFENGEMKTSEGDCDSPVVEEINTEEAPSPLSSAEPEPVAEEEAEEANTATTTDPVIEEEIETATTTEETISGPEPEPVEETVEEIVEESVEEKIEEPVEEEVIEESDPEPVAEEIVEEEPTA